MVEESGNEFVLGLLLFFCYLRWKLFVKETFGHQQQEMAFNEIEWK